MLCAAAGSALRRAAGRGEAKEATVNTPPAVENASYSYRRAALGPPEGLLMNRKQKEKETMNSKYIAKY